MREVRPGVWHWQAPHPDWDKEQWWPELVSWYGVQVGDEFLLFDPLSVPDELRQRATAVVLTAPYHERDARRLGLPVHTPPADTWQAGVGKFGIAPTACAAWRVRTLLGCARAKAKDTFTVLERGRSVSPRT